MNRKIFVGSIPVSASKLDVLDFFKKKAEVSNFSIIVKKKNKNFICGILQCNDEENARKILNSVHVYDGVQLECHPFMRGKKLKSYKSNEMSKNVYVANIPYDCHKSQISEIFLKFGEIEKIRFLHSHRFQEKYCIVTFEEQEAADEALRVRKIDAFGGFIKVKRYKSSKFPEEMINKVNHKVKDDSESYQEMGIKKSIENEYIFKERKGEKRNPYPNNQSYKKNERYYNKNQIKEQSLEYEQSKKWGQRKNNRNLYNIHVHEENYEHERTFQNHNRRNNQTFWIQTENLQNPASHHIRSFSNQGGRRWKPNLKFSDSEEDHIKNSSPGFRKLVEWVRRRVSLNKIYINHQGDNIRFNQPKKPLF